MTRPPQPSSPADPLILVLDTASTACQAVLARGSAVVAGEHADMARGHGEELVPMVERVLAGAGATYEDLDRLAVTVGPGSFTGLRVALAAARGFSATLGIEVAGIGSLAALALSDRLESGIAAPRAVALDARNGLVYGQRFDASGAPLEPPQAMADLVFAASVEADMRLVGNAQKVIAALVRSAGRPVTLGATRTVPSAQALAALAAVADPRERPQPLYLRGADAAVAQSAGLRAETP